MACCRALSLPSPANSAPTFLHLLSRPHFLPLIRATCLHPSPLSSPTVIYPSTAISSGTSTFIFSLIRFLSEVYWLERLLILSVVQAGMSLHAKSFWRLCWGVPVSALHLALWQGSGKCLLTKQMEEKQAFGPCAVPTDNFISAIESPWSPLLLSLGSAHLCQFFVTNCAAKSWRAEADLHPWRRPSIALGAVAGGDRADRS